MNKFLFLFLIVPIFLNAQNDESKYDFALSPGLIVQKGFFTELNLIAGEVVVDNMMMGIRGLRIGAESNLKSKSEFIIAPKIGFEISLVLFSGRISAINYFQNGNSEFRVVPEIGFSIGGLVNLTHGYGVKFEKSDIPNLSQHRIALTFNLNRKLIKGI
jgi:hypothetical protein